MKSRLLAYFAVALMAAYSLYQSNEAIKLARTVDNQGDIRACENENLIRTESNKRDSAHEQTARLQVEAFEIISEADRLEERGVDTNQRLRAIAKRAREVQVEFPPAKLTDCAKAFPKP